MNFCNCNRCNCTTAAILVSVILGVVAAFLQITAVVTVTPVFLWAALGSALVYLAVLLLGGCTPRMQTQEYCLCTSLNAVLLGVLGTAFFAVILLAVGITATSVVSAILVGLLTAFFTLLITSIACYIRNLYKCSSNS